MDHNQFNTKFNSRVSSLTYEKQFELAISVCKKLFPDYKDFCQEYKWGDPDVIIDTIEFCQIHKDREINSQTGRAMLSKIDDITPDTEDFSDCSYALNACTSVYETLEFIIDKNSKHILNIGTYFTDTIDFKIQEDRELTEGQIDGHPLMIEARRFLLSS